MGLINIFNNIYELLHFSEKVATAIKKKRIKKRKDEY